MLGSNIGAMSPPRGPYAKTADIRETVLDITLRMVDEIGYEDLTFTAVAKECGMSKAGLLYHFDSWHELLLAALERRRNLDADRIANTPNLSDAFALTFEHNSQVPGAVALFTAMAGHAAASPKTDSAGRQFFERHYQEATAEFTRIVSSEQERGLMDPDVDPKTVARILLAVSDGLQIQWLLDPGIGMAEHFKVLGKLMAGGFRENPPAVEIRAEPG